jgi:signal transduction histidine kinase
MRRSRLFRTSSFRLALMYAALTGVSFLVLFGVIFLSTTRFMRHQIDDSVTSELEEIFTDAHGREVQAVSDVVRSLSQHPAGFYYLLQDSRGGVLAGNLPAIDPLEGVLEWGGRRNTNGERIAALRGRGVGIPGAYLFVGWSTHQLHEMEDMVVRTFAWGLAASSALALVGGVVMSGRLMRRIETVSQMSRDIIASDLRQRLPVTPADDELDHLSGSINAMLDRIQALMDDLRQVTTDIAHDLRTPLTRLRQRLELASRPEVTEQSLRTALGRTVGEIDGILDVFGALLRIAQIESGARRTGFVTVDIGGLMGTIAELYRSMIEEKGQSLTEIVDSDLSVRGDRQLLLQLFANLLENAIRHTRPGAALEIRARRESGGVVVSVRDDGPGIPADMRSKVLQRFFRLETSRTTAGNGLGLSLVNAIVKMHDASLQLSDAKPGLCATVILRDAR